MSSTLPPAVRTALIRLAQVAVTCVFFSFFNAIAVNFEVENGVSILFPATAVAIVACMSFGIWAAIGVVIGTVLTPWSPNADLSSLVISGAICAAEGMIPHLVFRWRRDLTADLRDMKSLVAFLLFGTVLNTGVSAILGNLLVVQHPPGVPFDAREAFVWWIADFTAALLFALPALAFGGALLSKLLRNVRPERPRTITNALQIVTVVILLGFAASFAIRMYLLDRLEVDRIEQQRTWLRTQELLNRMHANFLRGAFLDGRDPNAAAKLAAARQAHEKSIAELTPLLAAVSPQLREDFRPVAAATTRWFEEEEQALHGRGGAPLDPAAGHEIGRQIFALHARMEQANGDAWLGLAAKRQRIMTVAGIVDGLVFVILVLASATLLYNVSRPFAQIRAAIRRMREGVPLDAASIDVRYLEFRSIAETLEETSRELRRREDELRLQTERAVRASQHKSEFLAKMSHELRTPLNSIIGFSDLLIEQEETIETSKRLNFLDNVANSARHLLKLINDLLDIAKVESGKMKMEFENVDLRMAIANTVASTQSLFVRKRQEVDWTMPPEPMLVRADQGRVEQVLLNLLSNANKFSPEGETITIRSGGDERHWQIEVTDRGIGISPEDQQRIFEDFEQVYTRGEHSAGTGLGLALAKRFVDAHGGTIDVESAPGAGSTFRVTLPRLM